MPIITQSRQVPGERYQYTHSGKNLAVSKWIDWTSGSQTTTSFRSGSKFALQEQDDSVVSASQQGDGLAARRNLNRALREENRGRYDNGHDFSTLKTEASILSSRAVLRSPASTGYTYRGWIAPDYGTTIPVFPIIASPITQLQIEADGRLLISRTIPTKPEAGLAQFLGELRERLPSIVGAQSLKHGVGSQSLGSEYLNVEFGIKPLIADIRKMCLAIVTANKQVSQYARDSGRVVRRKASLRESTSVSILAPYTATTNIGVFSPGVSANNTYLSQTGTVQTVDFTKINVWFSGAYSYHLSEAHNFLGQLQRYEQQANHLLGSRITPELIWELTPWSWLFDWFGDFGTFVSNVTALTEDSTVLRYGYVMHRHEVSRTRSSSAIEISTGRRVSSQVETKIISKKRTKATPYGFGIDVSALSPRRWAILGALGMTKAPRSLR